MVKDHGEILCFSTHARMSSIISALGDILSKDDKNWKLFVACWRSWGHQRPFKGQHQAKAFVEAVSLFRLLNLKMPLSDSQSMEKLDIAISRRQFLVDAADILFQEGKMEDQDGKCVLMQLHISCH